ncbi:MAG: recombinase family protein [bacterium]
MMEKVGVYCRLSSEDKNKVNKTDDSNSIVNQKNMCLKYALANNWDIFEIYVDDDYSGAGVERPAFNRLIEDCKNGKINIVLCKSQSRFSRDIEVVEKYFHNLFIQWKIRFVGIVDNADTSIPSNKKSRQVNGLMNEWYLDDLSQNIKKSLKSKREDGKFMGSFAPYGYKRSEEDKHKLVIDHIPAKVIYEIFEMYNSGNGYHKIAKYLNENSVITPSNYKKMNGSNYVCGNSKDCSNIWNEDTIYKILRNETYNGSLVQGKRTSLGCKVHKCISVSKKDWCVVKNTHDAIISDDLWNNVQIRLGKNQKPTRNGEIHFFSRKVYCADCSKIFTRNIYNCGEIKRAYLQCKSAKRYKTCDNNKSMRLDDLEKIVLNAINDLINNYTDQSNMEESYEKIKNNNDIDTLKKVLEKEKKSNDSKVNQLRSYYRKLYEDKIKEIIDEDMFISLSTDYKKEIQTLVSRNNIIDSEIGELNLKKENRKGFTELIEKYKEFKELNKIIVDEFIDKIYIGHYDKENNMRNIEILWNFNI